MSPLETLEGANWAGKIQLLIHTCTILL